MAEPRDFSRRQFLRGLGAAPFACPVLAYAGRGVPAFLSSFHEAAAAERKRPPAK